MQQAMFECEKGDVYYWHTPLDLTKKTIFLLFYGSKSIGIFLVRWRWMRMGRKGLRMRKYEEQNDHY